ncbi:MAG TPA: hypothetical protein VFT22_30285 [Kofleriaceae bacterium]|nr:hypothetical protein [Kofleriaceae bacterium]
MTQAKPEAPVADALAAWRRTGSPSAAAELERTTRAALGGWTAPATSSPRAFQRAWILSVGDPIGRGWAIEHLMWALPGEDPLERAVALAKRVEVLARHGPDPRLARAYAMVRDSDIRLEVPRLAAALSRLDAASRIPPAEESMMAELPDSTPEIDALWRTVRAHPDDDAALSVLADALQIAGDPRGELIALQLDVGRDDPARAERRKALIASCGARWLGRLTEVTGAASFERGAVRRLQLSSELPAEHPRWTELSADPVLATITDLLPGNVSGAVYARFITSPQMRSLAQIELFDRPSLAALEHAAPSITHVACYFPFDREWEWCSAAELFRALTRRSGLGSITITETAFDDLAATAWFPQLSAVTLGVHGSVRRGLTRWQSLPRSMTLTLVPSLHLPGCDSAFPWDFGITLRRDGDATVARISGEWLLLPFEVLEALPPDVARVEVEHPSAAIVDRVAGAVGRRGVEVVHQPVPRVAAVFVPTARDRTRAARRAPRQG